MKVSVNWIRKYLDFDLPATDELVARIGAQLGEVEEVVDFGAKYRGAVLVNVVECSKLENSDHLQLCFIDDGGATENVTRREDGLVQVVCGAPNVAAGVTVVWLPPGVTVPSTYDTDPFVLEARELRGTVSNGMLASPKELALGDSHDGLLLLDGEHKPGTSLIEAFDLNDQIIDIENKMFTHRPDCFGQLGVAREVAGILGKPFTSPDEYLTPSSATATGGLQLEVRNDVPELVPRFITETFENITIGPSPVCMQTYLVRAGIRPINNVVDITNYFMLLTGQPSHAYDYDKVAALSGGEGAVLVVRHPRKDEQLTLLSGKTITPRDEAIMIATDKQAIGLGGVMGGADTEVDASTKNIILEVATFDMYSIRRTSMAHGLFTDAVTRFNKGQSPLQNDRVAAMLRSQLMHDAGATPAGLHDLNTTGDATSVHPTVQVTPEFINARLGLSLSGEEMQQLLTNVEFTVGLEGSTLSVAAPFWRTDIETREDVVEEIGRLYGFDKLPLELPKRDITPAPEHPLLAQKSAIRDSLSRAGANEVLTYSFVHGNLIDKASQKREHAYKISNALSPDLQYYRLSALPSLLDKVHPNIKAGYDEFALFEL
ncbi:MAG TPA: phenylalanine--tRNA ligase subunit beta, partial [Candidatus Saccharimonadales bacterium]